MSARKPPRRKAAGSARAKRKTAGARRPGRSPREAALRRKQTQRKQTGAGAAARRVTRAGARPRLRLVKPAAPPPAFPQAQAGTSKQKVLFGLIRARVAVNAAIQGLSPASVSETVTADRGSVIDLVLDLAAHDRAALHALEAALRGMTPDLTPAAPPNADPARSDWPAAIRRLHAERDRLIEALESVPEEPVAVWDPVHPFGALVAALAARDREHAEAIKRWRTTRDS